VIDFEAMLRPMIAELVREELAKARPGASPDLVTVAEYARRRSISPSTVRHAIAEHRLQVTRIGRAVRVRADAEIGQRPSAQAVATAARDVRRLRLIGGR
jgi:excisionase family DNA binding protein